MSGHPLNVIKEADPELFDRIQGTRDFAFRDGEISKKHKILIALAIDIAKNSESGIKSLALQALECGATKKEIMETVRLAHFICGGGSMYPAAQALKDVL